MSPQSRKLFALTVAALGVVYGDIGTSPLYAVNEIFFGHTHVARSPEAIFGAISLIFWALTLIISIKYIIFVLRADYDSEGGVFALFGLLQKYKGKLIAVISTLLLFAAGLLYGDGIITPAISVLSAVEGLRIVTASFDPYILPITLAILTGLFIIQHKGTAKIGRMFGPVIAVWFLTLGCLGMRQILFEPAILQAANPLHALRFLTGHSLREIFQVLGSVILVVTGGEALYADLGHFGSKPIRVGWFSLAYPALLLNYLGQGAYLLGTHVVPHGNVFYALAPDWFLIPLVILATSATIIASQALISGAFSLTAQGMSLNLFPHFKIMHTHREYEGQIYIPLVNWMLFLGCASLVLVFRSSTNFAAAYGMAVSGVMLLTSLALALLAVKQWRWPIGKTLMLFGLFISIDTGFLSAASLKILHGGWIPLFIGLGILAVMFTWRWGRREISHTYRKLATMTLADLIALRRQDPRSLPISLMIMTRGHIETPADKIPSLQLFLENYKLLADDIVFVHVDYLHTPSCRGNRHVIVSYSPQPDTYGIYSITLSYGFMEKPDIETTLKNLYVKGELPLRHPPDDWLIQVVHERLMRPVDYKLWKKLKYYVFYILHKNADRTYRFFGLGNEIPLTMDVVRVKVK
ncbi:MAG TPA: KUP/HAK/KT family potassium transporter [bacterium]|nr:KUP/HAK/KT family potassium transporter [bacterium]